MQDAGPEDQRDGGEGSREILEAKYLDYCSAQLADLLLYLSADEIYLLAQRAARDLGREGASTYVESVELATEWLSAKVVLPPFEIWVQDYLAHPEVYEKFLMGFWESAVDASED